MTVRVVVRGAGPWTIDYLGDDGAPLTPQRSVTAVDLGGELEALLARLTARDLADPARLGDLLHAVLFGDQFPETAGAVELVFEPSDSTLRQYPWELAHNQKGYLFRCRQLIRRVVRNDRSSPTPRVALSPIPRVLFVVGARANDPEIRPGAEYLGILRQARAIRTHLLLRATVNEVRTAIASFKPDVVHFICHGNVSLGKAVLNLLQDDRETFAPLAADQLDALLEHDGRRPPVVIFNACETGLALGMKGIEPLAGELCRRGVAVTIGMSGSIDDNACRMFAHAWYRAMSRGTDLIAATTQARAAAQIQDRSIGWAQVTLFLRDDVVETFSTGSPEAARWRQTAFERHPAPFRPVHVGRWAQLHIFDQLLAEPSIRQSVLGREVRVLAFRAVPPPVDPHDENAPELGCTYLCRELAARAAAQGHLVIHLDRTTAAQLAIDLEKDPTEDALVARIVRKVLEVTLATAQSYGLGWQPSSVPAGTRAEDAEQVLSQTLRGRASQAIPPSADDWGFELKRDLASLAAALVDRSFAGAEARIVLLVDDLQSLNRVLVALLNKVLTRALQVPSFCAGLIVKVPSAADDNARQVERWLADLGCGLVLDLLRFDVHEDGSPRSAKEAWLAHRHNLLAWRDSDSDRNFVALVPRDVTRTVGFLAELAASPGDFDKNVALYVKKMRRNDFFEVADDDLALERLFK